MSWRNCWWEAEENALVSTRAEGRKQQMEWTSVAEEEMSVVT